MKRLSALARKILHFLSRGPRHHLVYIRWKSLTAWQRIVPSSYKNVPDESDAATLRRFRQRDEPLFFFRHSEVGSRAASVADTDQAETIAAADSVCNLEFSFRGAEPVRFDSGIDWSLAPGGNKDWCWDLNRHEYFETLGKAYAYTGDDRYVEAFDRLLNDWLDHNPPDITAENWCHAFEVGYRLNSWTWAFYLFRGADALRDRSLGRLLGGIRRHGRFLYTNIELHARNNHLLLEAKALLFAACLFPEFAESARWRKRALHILCTEVRGQVHPDGVHGELSTHYHRVIAGELLEMQLLLDLNGEPFPADVKALISAMAVFEANIIRPDGLLPLFGDSSQEDNYARVSASNIGPCLPGMDLPPQPLTESSAWRIGCSPDEGESATPLSSRQFPDGGYSIMRSGQGDDQMYLAVDCGHFGLPSDPHHGHADALSFELFCGGRPWIIDSGVYSTHADWPWRRYFRGTRSHNTVMVDEADQTVLIDSRRAGREAKADCNHWTGDESIDFFEGSHDGYRRLTGDIVHTRSIWFVRGEYWLVLDRLSGAGHHYFESNFHLPHDCQVALDDDAPGATVSSAEGSLVIRHAAPAGLALQSITGGEDPIQGWRSYISGQKIAAPTLSLAGEAGLPLATCALIAPAALAGCSDAIVSLSRNNGTDAAAVSVDFGLHTDYFFTGASAGDLYGYATDAEFAWVRNSGGRITRSFCNRGSITETS